MKILKSTIACFLLLNSAVALSETVKMYSQDRPPSAEEMANILFGQTAGKKAPRIKTRSINFAKKSAPVPATPAPETALKQAQAASIGLPIQFGYNSAEILPESYRSLDEVAKMLQMEGYQQEKLLIEGHTDASGSENYNRYLSEKRAQAVKNYLVNRFNISANRLFVSGKGEADPLPGLSPYSPKNRRVQFYKAP